MQICYSLVNCNLYSLCTFFKYFVYKHLRVESIRCYRCILQNNKQINILTTSSFFAALERHLICDVTQFNQFHFEFTVHQMQLFCIKSVVFFFKICHFNPKISQLTKLAPIQKGACHRLWLSISFLHHRFCSITALLVDKCI